jgi:hypothetical protein
MFTVTGPFICQCKIESGKIVFCPPHAAAETLIAACGYLRDLLRMLKYAEPGEANLVRNDVIPYLERVIESAEKKP